VVTSGIIKQHEIPWIYQTQGYTRQTVTICSFRSNMPRACQQAKRDPQAEKSVDEPA
jgi:hypothetical protein